MTARGLNPWQIATVTIGSVAAVVIVASFLFPGRPSPIHVPMRQQAVDPTEPPVHKLPDGTQVSLVAVSDNGAQRSWTPAGRALEQWVMQERFRKQKKSLNPNRDNWRSFVVSVRRLGEFEESPSVAFRFGGARVLPAGNVGTEGLTGDRWLATILQRFPSSTQTISLSYGVSTVPWRTVGSALFPSRGTKGIAFDPSVSTETTGMSGPRISVMVRISEDVTKDAYDVVAFDAKGKPMGFAGITPVNRNGQDMTWHELPESGSIDIEYWFLGRKEDVDRVELRARPYHWFEVHSVRVHPPD